ncbi:MAG TPA: division/cell wall cluster transcriptional repressor MraZ [Phaeodactylibacter sp.]|nr:division/cell wall cluster transcriptional repressor MraZ [Phaeodactylibacter sp.]
MPQLLGEYDCKIDSKGRVRVPSPLLKQLGEMESYAFVVNRGIEDCLTLYPKSVWDEVSKEVNDLNTYVKKNRAFVRYFFRGATALNTDGSDRILLPKKLLEYAGIEKELVLFAHTNKIEIWAKDKYDNVLEEEPEDFSDLAEEVMGKVKKGIPPTTEEA